MDRILAIPPNGIFSAVYVMVYQALARIGKMKYLISSHNAGGWRQLPLNCIVGRIENSSREVHMALKSCWPGPENSTPINSRAISEFNTHNPTPYRSTFVHGDDFRVRIALIGKILNEMEANDIKGRGQELTQNIKDLKAYFFSCMKLDDFALPKVVNYLVERINKFNSESGYSRRVIALKRHFSKELLRHKSPNICDKASKILMND